MEKNGTKCTKNLGLINNKINRKYNNVNNKYRVLVINQGFVLLIKVSAKNKSEALLNPLLLIHANVSDFIILVYLKKNLTADAT